MGQAPPRSMSKLQEICHQKNKLGTTDWALGTFRLRIADCGFEIRESVVRSQNWGFGVNEKCELRNEEMSNETGLL